MIQVGYKIFVAISDPTNYEWDELLIRISN